MLGLVIFLKQGDVLQLRVTVNAYVFGKRRIVKWSAADWIEGLSGFCSDRAAERIATFEKSHTVNPWRVVFPEIVSLVLTSTCWPNTVMTGEVHEHRRSVACSSLCPVSVGLHGVYLLLLKSESSVILCLNIYPLSLCLDFIRKIISEKADQETRGLRDLIGGCCLLLFSFFTIVWCNSIVPSFVFCTWYNVIH